MHKYLYLYKSYLLKVSFLSLFLLALCFFQFGFKSNLDNFNTMFKIKVGDLYLTLQFIFPLFLFDNFYPTKSIIIRETKFFVIPVIERIIISIIMIAMVRLIAYTTYSIIIFHNINIYETLIRIFIIDIGSILILHILSNIFLSKYISFITSCIINLLLYNFMIGYYEIIKVDNDGIFSKITGISFLYVIILFIISIISKLIQKEYNKN